MATPNNNAELREMAKDALEHWMLDSETDPEGDIKFGLEYLASPGDIDGDVLSLFEGCKIGQEWDRLEELAKNIGSQRCFPWDAQAMTTIEHVSKVKYECPNCDTRAWAKPDTFLLCGLCTWADRDGELVEMQAVSGDCDGNT